MSTPQNIQTFNEVTGRIFAELYASFPVPLDLFTLRVSGLDCSNWEVPSSFHEMVQTLGYCDLEEPPQELWDYNDDSLGMLLTQQPPCVADEIEKRLNFIVDAVDWLKGTGFITASRNTRPYIRDAVLTAKGLEALSAMPSSISGEKPLGEKLIDQAKKGGKSVLGETVKQVLAVGIGLGAHHFGLTP